MSNATSNKLTPTPLYRQNKIPSSPLYCTDSTTPPVLTTLTRPVIASHSTMHSHFTLKLPRTTPQQTWHAHPTTSTSSHRLSISTWLRHINLTPPLPTRCYHMHLQRYQPFLQRKHQHTQARTANLLRQTSPDTHHCTARNTLALQERRRNR